MKFFFLIFIGFYFLLYLLYSIIVGSAAPQTHCGEAPGRNSNPDQTTSPPILTLKKVLAGSKNHKLAAWTNVHWQTIFVVKKVLIFRTAVEKQGLDCQIWKDADVWYLFWSGTEEDQLHEDAVRKFHHSRWDDIINICM